VGTIYVYYKLRGSFMASLPGGSFFAERRGSETNVNLLGGDLNTRLVRSVGPESQNRAGQVAEFLADFGHTMVTEHPGKLEEGVKFVGETAKEKLAERVAEYAVPHVAGPVAGTAMNAASFAKAAYKMFDTLRSMAPGARVLVESMREASTSGSDRTTDTLLANTYDPEDYVMRREPRQTTDKLDSPFGDMLSNILPSLFESGSEYPAARGRFVNDDL
jgi:hypothetical protein